MSVADSMADSGRKPAVYSQLTCFLLYMVLFPQEKIGDAFSKENERFWGAPGRLEAYGIYRKHGGLTYWFFFIFIDFSLIEAVRWDDVQLSFYWAE